MPISSLPTSKGTATSHLLLDQFRSSAAERKTEYGPHDGRHMAALHAPALAAPPSSLLGDDAGITDY
ncbi:unnamed protein product [Sphagnum troendelagicum]|uniref:Uncharacterized protein n=1 Tax=Sphagnum troendelagicum TaxID=128251 RepID=A0ABP0UL17_9BRYO